MNKGFTPLEMTNFNGKNTMKNRENNQEKSLTGFTLIELIVVIVIVGILSVMMLTNYNQGSQNLKEQESIQFLVQAIRSAQNKALGAEVVNCTNPPCRYGVHLVENSSSIIIFGDGTNGGSNTNVYEFGIEEIIEEYKLEEGVEIINISDNTPGPQPRNILFEPPDPATTLCRQMPGPICVSSGSSITVTITGGRSIEIGEGGSVDIN